MPVSIRRQANGEIPPSSIPSICRYKCRSFTTFRLSSQVSCFSSAIWISFPIIWNDYSKSYGLRLLPCLTSCIPPKVVTGHGEINSTCMISCAIWRKGCRRTIRWLICDADCLCMRPLEQLFSDTRKYGSALYDASDRPDLSVNGITLKEMTDIYNDCYVEKEKREKEKEATKKTGAEKEEAGAARYEKRSHKNRACPLLRGRIYLAAW